MSVLETNFDLSHQKTAETARMWREKARMLGEFAHEINNPLSIAINATHLLKAGCEPSYQEYIRMLEDSILRIAEFVRKSADLHRLARRDEHAP